MSRLWRRPSGTYAQLADLPWHDATFTAIDLETTGLDLVNDQIVSVGTVRIQGGRIDPSTSCHLLVQPGCEVSNDSTLIHSLRTQDLESCPTIDEVVPSIVREAQGSVLVAHAAWVERAFLSRALPSNSIDLRDMIDTAALARAAGLREPGTHEPSLEGLARELNLPVHTPHEALGDAFTTAQVLLVLATRLETASGAPLTVADLCRLSRKHGM